MPAAMDSEARPSRGRESPNSITMSAPIVQVTCKRPCCGPLVAANRSHWYIVSHTTEARIAHARTHVRRLHTAKLRLGEPPAAVWLRYGTLAVTAPRRRTRSRRCSQRRRRRANRRETRRQVDPAAAVPDGARLIGVALGQTRGAAVGVAVVAHGAPRLPTRRLVHEAVALSVGQRQVGQ